jgi:flavorubredoxin
MNPPTVNAIPNVAPGVDQLGTYIAPPGFGYLAVNAYLLRSQQPVLVDTGIGTLQEATLNALAGLIDPAGLRWIYLTHVDGDHVGCLDRLLALAPRARIVTTYLGMAKLSFTRILPPERFWLLNPGETLDVGDRRLLALRPPCFDAPETTMLWDATSRTLFSSDYFGALVPSPVASAEEIPPAALREGMLTFLAVDTPWVRSVVPASLEQATRNVQELQPRTVLGSHLAPARGLTDALSETIRMAPGGPVVSMPDQATFERMLSGAAGG